MKNISRLIGYSFCISCLCITTQSLAQSLNQYVVASGGVTSTLTGGDVITFTIGEPIISTAGTNPILSQGFNQPRLISNPLPIKVTFTGVSEQGGNRLHWTTYQEVNNNYFDLESSIDGVTFAAISRIKSKALNGNSSINIEYSFLDNSFGADKTFYRLKQVDYGGRFMYSNVVALENGSKPQKPFSFYPNPATSNILIETPENGDLSIIDINGQVMTILKINGTGKINVAQYAAGIYYIKFKGNNSEYSASFVKE